MDPSAANRDRRRDGLRRLAPVRWLHPAQLVRVGAQVAQARMFGAFGARRENEAAQPAEMYDMSLPSEEVWIDYTADVGDGFDATYAVARSIAADPLPGGDPAAPPHGDLLVLGGDETYPVASESNYEARTASVYGAALPDLGPASPAMLAVPGNHDWYDGLTAFLRTFCQGWLADVPLPIPRKGTVRMVDPHRRTSAFVGGWRTVQSRSYFAVRLPYGWWLWGTDIQFDTYIDAPQLAYFAEAATHVGEDDNIIICTAKPTWVDPRGSDTIEQFLGKTLGDRADAVRLICSGDRHHYSRYTRPAPVGPAALVTCGGGGAYLSPTHHLPETVRFGRWADDEGPEFRRTQTFPDAADSRRISRRFWQLPWRNPALTVMLGPVYIVLLWLLAATQPGDGALDRLLGYSLADTRLAPASLPALFGCLLVGAATLGLARPRRDDGWRAVAGVAHGAAHLALLVVATYAVGAVAWPGNAFVASVLLTVVGSAACGIIGANVLATYLFLCQVRRDLHGNELFAGLRVEDFKSYLRLRVGPDGVRIYPVGLRTVPHRWRPSAEGPLLDPVGGSAPELIEEPFTIPPR
ncbi:metallophosphoesterase [Solicola gregarius]|uniref:Metallophosphoesterase n=1 Tax=Solicola gregarius TaxID=2908642 RepID=A0AA46TG10_9ACTN|nr:metallophosphoesterase [Solicola gregarius]UYM04503.1 metallophosphoesterase [Solicola gregarius]